MITQLHPAVPTKAPSLHLPPDLGELLPGFRIVEGYTLHVD